MMVEKAATKDPLKYYDEIATSYNHHYLNPYESYRFQHITTQILNFLPGESGLYLHDVGCGTGEYTIPYFEQLMPNVRIHASDFSAGMVNVCRDRFPEHEHSIQDVEKMTMPSGLFDVLTSRQLLEHVPNPDKALQEMYRVLKPGGLLVLSTPSWFGLVAPLYFIKRLFGGLEQPIDDWWTPFGLKSNLADAGFRDITFTSVCFVPFHSKFPQFPVPLVKALDRLIERLPLSRYIGRVLIVRARKPESMD